MPLADPIPIDFVEERPQTHTQPLRRRAAVALGCLEGLADRSALGILNDGLEGLVPGVLTP